MNRLNFIKKVILGIVSLEIGYLFFDAFKTNSKAVSTSDLILIGNAISFDKNKIYSFNSEKFYISVLEDGGMLALSIKCTHLGCMVQAKEDGFICPCHASSFDKYGEVLSPPATRALDIFPISISNGDVFVDVNNPIKRDSYNKSQLIYI